MIDTVNYGRLSEGLLIYQIAMQRFIARTLRTANNGAGDWFRDLALTSLKGDRLKNLERNLTETDDGSNPEQLLDASHFPEVIDANWELFRGAFKDRNQVKSQTRRIRKWRPPWAHPSDKTTGELTNANVDERLETCQLVVGRFDSEAAKRLETLRTRTNADADAAASNSMAGDESTSPVTDNSEVDPELDARIEQWRAEHAEKVKRLRRKFRLYQQAAARKAALSVAERALADAESDLYEDVQEEWSEAHSFQWDDCLAGLLQATFDAGYPRGHLVEDYGNGSGTIQFDVSERDLRFDIEIKIELRDG